MNDAVTLFENTLQVINTLLMWALRIFVKTLYDVAFSNTRAIRVLIYGAMAGGVGLAKNINSQRPRKFVVKGFISHYKKAKHQEIMGGLQCRGGSGCNHPEE